MRYIVAEKQKYQNVVGAAITAATQVSGAGTRLAAAKKKKELAKQQGNAGVELLNKKLELEKGQLKVMSLEARIEQEKRQSEAIKKAKRNKIITITIISIAALATFGTVGYLIIKNKNKGS